MGFICVFYWVFHIHISVPKIMLREQRFLMANVVCFVLLHEKSKEKNMRATILLYFLIFSNHYEVRFVFTTVSIRVNGFLRCCLGIDSLLFMLYLYMKQFCSSVPDSYCWFQ